MQDLLETWAALLARHTANPGVAAVGRELLASWSEPHRRYHGVGHLRDILAHVEELAGYADDADAVRLAAWYHDSVYAGLPDDEERSARRAEGDLSELDLEPQLIDEVARLARMTITHDPAPGDHNGEVLSDADLASLAVPRERYVLNTADIRAEYAHIPDEVFRKGRLQVLVGLLEGQGVFRTERARGQWEGAAQGNLRAELATLTDYTKLKVPADLGVAQQRKITRRVVGPYAHSGLPGQNLPMADEQGPITVLGDAESWNLLNSVSLGRLVTHIGDQLELFPVNFVTQDGTVLFRTAEGTKLFSTVMNDKVLFEADDHTVAEGWSVIIRGTAQMLTSSDDIHDAERAQLLPWVPTEKLRFVRITPYEISGRHFQFGPEPDHGSYPS